MAELKYVAYCGIFCKHCSNIARIPRQAKELYDTLKREGYEYFGPAISGEFNDFWSYLKSLTTLDEDCPACRGGCGDPQCKIRICAQEKDKEVCVYCDEYPCSHFDRLASVYPNLISDGKKLAELGMEAWIREQELRSERGYCLADGRYDFPESQ